MNKDKTFRPKKKFPIGTLRYNLHKQAQATLHSGLDLKAAVRLPPNENFEDWLAVHTVDFFNRINLLYGIISDVCTAKSCPTMSGGARYEYLWQDGVSYKKPTRLSAPEYIFLLMDWIEIRINNETIFPSNTEIPFPRDFRQTCKKILTRLFRVFVHVYIHHFDRLSQLGAEPHANTLYKHFYYFITEHQMVSSRELDALARYEVTNCLTPDRKVFDTPPPKSVKVVCGAQSRFQTAGIWFKLSEDACARIQNTGINLGVYCPQYYYVLMLHLAIFLGRHLFSCSVPHGK
ncbi:unnamed protein product [Litomosoides sigmodontis]|uniref:Mob1/phocein family protein n=1 Tax=Litomosoides sigmodontis TaxID=42156 RepID=A0A3P6UK81_LITSI|nr:unnamed protein product [Litomosoides sigmodontis]